MTYHSETFEGIGVLNQVTVSDRSALAEAARLRTEIAALDLACSRFQDDSELALLNRAHGRPLRVVELLFDAVVTSLRAAERTDGLVDPTVGSSLHAIGYDRDFALIVIPGAPPTFAFVPAAGWEGVLLDHERRTVEPPTGCQIDLGATAKARAADSIAAAIRDATGSDVLVILGGDVSVDGAPASGWPIFVSDSSRYSGASGQTISLVHGGLATSSITVRRWRADGVKLHHLVDRATGASTSGPWRTVSVAAESCVESNTASTAAIVRGEGAVEWLESRGYDARLVARDGAIVRTGRWPDPQEAHSTAGSSHSRLTAT